MVKALCEELSIFHAVDPLVSDSQTPSHLYFRLHGKGGWRYRFTEEDLYNLTSSMKDIRFNQARVFFNNISMLQDARLFHGMCLKSASK